MAQSMAEYLMEQGRLQELRWIVRVLLEQRGVSLLKTDLDRLESCNDVQRLHEAVVEAARKASLEDLEL
jgi:hypothetical protein